MAAHCNVAKFVPVPQHAIRNCENLVCPELRSQKYLLLLIDIGVAMA